MPSTSNTWNNANYTNTYVGSTPSWSRNTRERTRRGWPTNYVTGNCWLQSSIGWLGPSLSDSSWDIIEACGDSRWCLCWVGQGLARARNPPSSKRTSVSDISLLASCCAMSRRGQVLNSETPFVVSLTKGKLFLAPSQFSSSKIECRRRGDSSSWLMVFRVTCKISTLGENSHVITRFVPLCFI